MKSEKILRSYTIIPKHLYVERSADVHLRRIVEDMGRPGYVLVARQMGKTNLLLNAKRSLGAGADKFIYLDVSNTFPTIKEFFQNIIDTSISSYPEAFREAQAVINELRAESIDGPPHKEHENELRELLKVITGRLVICLDEIDALTKTTYADSVFSLIRSTYFAGRVNIPEFERLTYVLSGVAEPSELIKNKNVSPFNIGEKIFLDDFSREEFGKFVSQANLPFDPEVIDSIFQWTNGNPRMSWDICSALEDAIEEAGQISVDAVNKTVHRLFLTNFDRPPIDHIRTLVETDGAVRDAIMSIHYGRAGGISDAVKNKLYLAGIIRPPRDIEEPIEIRNRLLQESLSESWIQDVEHKIHSNFELAEQRYKKGLYSEAISLYQEAIAEGAGTSTDQGLMYYRLGTCQFNLARYTEAIESLSKTLFGSTGSTSSLYYSIEHMLGLAKFFQKNLAESVEHYRNVLKQDIRGEEKPVLYFDACINLSIALLASPNIGGNSKEIISLNEQVILNEKIVRDIESSNYPADRLFCLANHNLALLYKRLNQQELGREYLYKAIEYAGADEQVQLLVELLDVTNDRRNRKDTLIQCVEIILDKRIAVQKATKFSPLGFTPGICAKLIEKLQSEFLDNYLDRLLKHLLDKAIPHEEEVDSIVSDAILDLLNQSNSKATLALLKRATDLEVVKKGSAAHRTILTYGVILTPADDVESLKNEYLDEYIYKTGSHLVPTDFRIIWELVRRSLSRQEFDVVERLIRELWALIEKITPAAESEFSESQKNSGGIVVSLLELEFYFAQRSFENVQERAVPLLRHIDKPIAFSLPYFDANFLESVRNRVRFMQGATKVVQTIRRTERKIGRNQAVNVRFPDGRILSGKYKKYQAQILEGKCELVDDD
jgi:tetratricopeptide (TPR) repeat protein